MLLVWDATCLDMLAPSHIALASREPGLVAEQAEQQRKAKYADLLTTHHFVPIGIETTGMFDPKALSFFKELGYHLRARSGDPLFFSHFFCNRLGSTFSEETPLQYSALLLVPGQE